MAVPFSSKKFFAICSPMLLGIETQDASVFA